MNIREKIKKLIEQKKLIHQIATITIFGAGVTCAFSMPALAQEGGTDTIDVNAEIAKFTAVATALGGVVTGFTAILITPMGISAASKIFKALVIYNM